MTTSSRGLTFVVVRGRRGQIGRDNALLWHLPEDLKFFKKVTMGRAMIMGRKTFDAIGRRALPGRQSIIVSRAPEADEAPVYWRASPEQALDLAYQLSPEKPACIGGAALYRLMLPLCNAIWTTDVDDDPPADAFFPAIDEQDWRETARLVLRAANPQAIARHLVRI